MNYEEVVLKVVEILNRLDIPYFLTGAMAVVYYGEPRTTHDIDLMVEMKDEDVATLATCLEADFSIDQESISIARREGSMFNAIHKDTGFKVDFWMLGNDDFDRTRFARRVRVNILGTVIYLPTAEDAIISKLAWFKMSDIDKHYFDALGIYRIQKEKLDMEYISHWANLKSIMEFWKRILANKTGRL